MNTLFKSLIVTGAGLGLLGFAGQPLGMATTFIVVAIVVALVCMIATAARGRDARTSVELGALYGLAVLGNGVMFLSTTIYILLIGAIFVSIAVSWVLSLREPAREFTTEHESIP